MGQTARWAELRHLMVEQTMDDKMSHCSFRAAYEPEDTVTLEEAGIEEGEAPKFGLSGGGVCEIVDWSTDGEDSRYETN